MVSFSAYVFCTDGILNPFHLQNFIIVNKQNYYKQAFQKCHHDIKKTWKLVNEIIAIKNKSPKKIGFLKTQNAKNNVKIWTIFSQKLENPFPQK